MHRQMIGSLVAFVAIISGCDDPASLRIDPELVMDTVTLEAPTVSQEDVAYGLDITAAFGSTSIGGAQFPHRQEDAEQWDFALLKRGGELVLLPAGALGVKDISGGISTAGITQAVSGKAFEQVVEAPGRSAFTSETGMVPRVGEVYVARSRRAQVCGLAQQYAKLQPLEIDAAQGRVRLQITTNARCGDPRLAPEE